MSLLVWTAAVLAPTAALLWWGAWRVGLRLQRREDEARRARLVGLLQGSDLTERAYEDAYKGPRQWPGAQRKLLEG